MLGVDPPSHLRRPQLPNGESSILFHPSARKVWAGRKQTDSPAQFFLLPKRDFKECFMYGFGVVHLDRAASGLTPSSATSRAPNTKAETGDPQSSGRFPSGPWGEAVTFNVPAG